MGTMVMMMTMMMMMMILTVDNQPADIVNYVSMHLQSAHVWLHCHANDDDDDDDDDDVDDNIDGVFGVEMGGHNNKTIDPPRSGVGEITKFIRTKRRQMHSVSANFMWLMCKGLTRLRFQCKATIYQTTSLSPKH
uniref:Uncharacterized protein n=1 Tax=Glossina pallidipes TaxID=7398 RepID=A0A1A9ZL22_GLOPL